MNCEDKICLFVCLLFFFGFANCLFLISFLAWKGIYNGISIQDKF